MFPVGMTWRSWSFFRLMRLLALLCAAGLRSCALTVCKDPGRALQQHGNIMVGERKQALYFARTDSVWSLHYLSSLEILERGKDRQR